MDGADGTEMLVEVVERFVDRREISLLLVKISRK